MKDNQELTEQEKIRRQRQTYMGYALRELPKVPFAVKYRHDARAPYFNRVIGAIHELRNRGNAA